MSDCLLGAVRDHSSKMLCTTEEEYRNGLCKQ